MGNTLHQLTDGASADGEDDEVSPSEGSPRVSPRVSSLNDKLLQQLESLRNAIPVIKVIQI
jgi:hypothetical protein